MHHISKTHSVTRHRRTGVALIIAALCAGTSSVRADTPLGDRVASELSTKHGATKGLEWGESSDNELLDGWLVQTPPDHWSMPYAQGVVPPVHCAPRVHAR